MEGDKKHEKKEIHTDFDPLHSVAVASGAGFTLLSCIGVGVWLGLKADEYLGTEPWGLVCLSVLGAVSGLWSLVKQLMGK
jgi:ATP synthase protein I